MPAPPHLGAGLGYRSALRKDILQNLREFDFLEVISDGFFRNEAGLRALASLIPCVPHSLNCSVGSKVDEAYLARVKRIVGLVQPPWHTDHLAFTRAGDLAVGHLAPVPYTEESLELVVGNIRRVQQEVAVPFAVENITMPFYWPNNTLEEHVFLREVVRRTGCGLLLDLENARVNAANHGGDPRRFLDALPLEHVVQVHLAGGVRAEGLEHDSHSMPVSEATWGLLEYLCEHVVPAGVLLERDGNFPPFADMVAEVRRARSVLQRAAAA